MVDIAKEKNKDSVREVRGALSVLKKLLSKSKPKTKEHPELEYPEVPLSLLLEGLINISASASTRIAADVLKLINSLFDGSHGNIHHLLVEEHWAPFLSVAIQCVEKAMPSTGSDVDGSSIQTVSTSNEDLDSEDNISNQARFW